jgi:hypothetical protein
MIGSSIPKYNSIYNKHFHKQLLSGAREVGSLDVDPIEIAERKPIKWIHGSVTTTMLKHYLKSMDFTGKAYSWPFQTMKEYKIKLLYLAMTHFVQVIWARPRLMIWWHGSSGGPVSERMSIVIASHVTHARGLELTIRSMVGYYNPYLYQRKSGKQ